MAHLALRVVMVIAGLVSAAVSSGFAPQPLSAIYGRY